jgi:hypothetical protein
VPTTRQLAPLGALVLILSACDGGGDAPDGGGADTGSPRDATTEDGGGGPDSAAPPDTGLGWDAGGTTVDTRSLTAGPYSVPSGVERTQCVSFDLGNDAPAMIRAIRTSLTAGSHHMIVYHLDEAPDPTPRDCAAFAHGVASSLFIAQQAEASIVYPEGAGFPVAAHQTIGIEIHYINYLAGDPIDISGTVEFDLVEPDPAFGTVELVFTGDLSIDIPARGTATEVSFHAVPAGARLFGLTSHTHQWGTRATIHRGTDVSSPGEQLHVSTDWSEPPLDLFDPPLTFAGGEGLILTCEYENTSDRSVGFGTGFDDEMCFLWAYLIR